MPNHPNRSRRSPWASPDPAAIRAAREAHGLTQTQAAAVIGATLRAWQDWEAGARHMRALDWHVWCHWVRGVPAAPLTAAAPA